MARILLGAGADVSGADAIGETPLHWVAAGVGPAFSTWTFDVSLSTSRRGRVEMAKVLLDAEATPAP